MSKGVLKRRIYEIVEVSDKNDIASRAYDIMMGIAVVVGLLPLMIKTTNAYTTCIDAVTVIIFAVDYAIRLYTADYKMGVKSYKSYLAYCITPLAIIDLLSMLPIFTIFFPNVAAIALFRIFRVLRILKLVRYSKTMVTIVNVLKTIRRQLLAVLVLTLIYIFASAMVIFQAEPELFDNFFDAIYWATISITTIGYGDITPQTTVGQLITIISSLAGVAIIALPSGIITAAYIDELKRKKSKHEVKHL